MYKSASKVDIFLKQVVEVKKSNTKKKYCGNVQSYNKCLLMNWKEEKLNIILIHR